MISAVVFDLDGTLVDTLDDLAASTNYALEKYGCNSHPTEAYKYFIGDGMAKLIERAIGEELLNEETYKNVFDCFTKHYRQNYLVHTCLYEGIKTAVLELKKMGIKLAVVSNKRDDMTQKIISEIFGDGVFDVVYGKIDGYPTKPNPALTLRAIKELGVTPNETAFVGDSGMDCANAVNSGCLPVGVLWGFRGEEELKQNGAAYLLENPSEIVPLVSALKNE